MLIATRQQRRLAALAVAAFLAALVTGCGLSGRTPRIVYVTLPPNPTASGAARSAAPGPSDTPAPTGAMPTIAGVTVTSSDPGGKWKVTFKKPVVGGVPDSVAGPINDAISAQVNGYVAAFTGQKLPAVAAGSGPSTLEGDYSIAYVSPAIISLRFSALTYVSGAAHPAGTPGSINIVVTSGRTIALADLFSDSAKALAIIAPKSHDSLSTLLGTDLTWDGKATSLDFFANAWVFTTAGLEFSWPQGDMASMAAGMPSAVVSWADLEPVLKPYSPAADFVK